MKYLSPLFWALCCVALGMASSLLQTEALHSWYPYLEQFGITPPIWVFSTVWTLLYAMMGFSFGLVLQIKSPHRNILILLFILQLFFTLLWNMSFFYLLDPRDGLVCLTIVLVLLALYIWKSRFVSQAASWLFAPYLLWCAFAWYLNVHIIVVKL